jgi:hypothetical protein
MAFKQTLWSPVEIEYLKKHAEDPLMQLCIALAKTKYAIKKKMQDLKTEDPNKDSGISKKKKAQSKTTKIGKRPDCNNLFFRSSWEANVFRLLRLDKNIVHIEYEPMDFTFWQFGIKKGTISYTPDFRVYFKDGSYQWIEVKGGWLKNIDKTKMRRFKKFYPEEFEKLVIVSSGPNSKTTIFFKELGLTIKWHYPDLNKTFKKSVPNWE